jgi:hypothetical protein
LLPYTVSQKLNFTNLELCISDIKSSLPCDIEIRLCVMNSYPHLSRNVSVNLTFSSLWIVMIELICGRKYSLNISPFGPLNSNMGILGRQQGDESTGWLKSHTAYIKIFIDGCSSAQFSWINKNAILL